MKIEFIISTMNCKNPIQLISKMNLLNKSDIYVTIVNQMENEDELQYLESNIRVIYSSKSGIGNSRNLGLANIREDTDIVCFTDDDLVYDNDMYDKINTIFKNNEDLDVAIFNIGSLTKNRQIKEITTIHKVNNTNIFRYALYNVAVRKVSLDKMKNSKFNTNFGGNSKYLCGEDSIFIYDLYKNKFNIQAFPIQIGMVDHKNSTWYEHVGTEHYFISKGALFYTCDKILYVLYIIYFAIKHAKIYNVSFFTILKQMFKGAKECMHEKRGK